MLDDRLKLFRQLEDARDRPLVIYVTSSRGGSSGMMSGDTVPELLQQLDALPPSTKEVDLLLVSNGGDPTVAWRIVSLIRERVEKFSVLVPEAAFSAATLIALGADEIVMHPHGNLGPTDPQIPAPRRGKEEKGFNPIGFGSEDLSAFLKFAREDVGLTDQQQMLSVFNHFCEQVGSVAVGVAARSAQLTVTMGEKLLQLHMKGEAEREKARAISEKLTRDFFHHGYPVSKTEAKFIGLPIAKTDTNIEKLMWQIWLDLSAELKLREPFNPMTLLRADEACAALFQPVPQVNLPANLPAQAQQQALQQILQQILVIEVPPTTFENIHAVMESARTASRYVSNGLIFASRQPDQQFKVSTVMERQGWVTMPISSGTEDDGTAPAVPRRKTAAKKKKVSVQKGE